MTAGDRCCDTSAVPGRHDPDRPGFHIPGDPDADRLEQFAVVSAELSAASSMAEVVAAAVHHAAPAVGASVSTLMLTEGDRLRLVAGRGLRSGAFEEWETFPLAETFPAGEAALSAAPVVLSGVADAAGHYPALHEQMARGRTLVCLPLDTARPSVGVLGLTFEAGWRPGDFLAQVSVEMGSDLDYQTTLANVANLSVPTLADWCAVDVLSDGEHRTVAVAHIDPEKVRWARELQERYPADYDVAHGVGNVFRTGRSEFYPEVTDEMLVAAARDDEHLRLSRELNMHSAIIVPIAGREETLGVLTLIRAGESPRYTTSDVVLAEEVGRRAGIAIENARLYGQTQDIALQLQRAVLPEAVDDLRYWEVAAHYAPGGRSGVGGDFYDAIALPDGKLALAIGDVMGHGVQAAAAMAQIRAATRAYVSLDPDPAAVVGNLDVMFARLAITQLVTLCYGVVDRDGETLEFVNAGHYPGLVVSAGNAPALLSAPTRLLLGAGGDDRSSTTVRFDAGDVLVLFTDGLVERRGEVVDEGLGRLAAAAPVLLGDNLAAGTHALVDALVEPGRHDDDVTVLTVRRRPV
jgi:GAF domain-containing protein